MPLITYGTERWSDVVHELERHWHAHWEEVGTARDKIKLDPDYDQYLALESQGALHVTVARCDGEVAGYVTAVVRPHLHYRYSLTAYFDLYYQAKTFRGGWRACAMFRAAETALRARGVQRMVTGTKKSKDMSLIFKRLGWAEIEATFAKVLI